MAMGSANSCLDQFDAETLRTQSRVDSSYERSALRQLAAPYARLPDPR